MEARGFNRDYRTGRIIASSGVGDDPVSYRNVHLDHNARTVLIDRPLVLDLGAVAKGLAIDLAARELAAIRALRDRRRRRSRTWPAATPPASSWSVGIRHPRLDREAIEVLRISGAAVCTSGDYERRASGADAGHHILDSRSGASATALVSATVIAPTAMLADALATAAFVLGPDEGLRLLERHGVDGVLFSPTLERFATRGMTRDDRRG